MWTADKILSLQPSQARRAFANDKGEKNFKALLRHWHPDVCQAENARLVFEHLMFLRSSLNGGAKPGVYVDMTLKGQKKRLHVLKEDGWYGGRRWVSNSYFVWEFNDDDVYEKYMENISKFSFNNQDMEKQFKDVFPHTVISARLLSGRNVILVKRNNRALLADWLQAQGPFPAKHAAWLGSGLLNILCWSDWANWLLPGISVDSVAIDPQTHTVSMPLGWEVAVPSGEKPLFVPQRVFDVFPALSAGKDLPTGIGSEMCRQTLKEALGDASGMSLHKLGVPENMRKWLMSPPGKSSVTDYQSWFVALQEDFGKRRFIKWDVTPEDIYMI